MVKRPSEFLQSEQGMVLVVAVLMLAVVSIIGIAALTTSHTEIQISNNERMIAAQFYNAEAGMIDTVARRSEWMTEEFVVEDETTASYVNSVDADADGMDDASVSLKCVQEDETIADTNNLPKQNHTDEPPAGSGYSMKYFEIRRYGITATSQEGNTQLQIGIYKIFNKF